MNKKGSGQKKESLQNSKEAQEDPLLFKVFSVRKKKSLKLQKPRPQKLEKEKTTENLDIDESGEVIERKAENGKYKPPKISAMLSKEDKIDEKKKKQLERKKKFMLRTSFIHDLEGEFSSRPNEDKLKNIQNEVYDKEERERIEFEEENFIRLPVKKKDKIKLRKKMRQAQEEKIDDFREMENIREVLKMDGMIEEEEKKMERRKKIEKTLGSYIGVKKRKNIRKFKRKK